MSIDIKRNHELPLLLVIADLIAAPFALIFWVFLFIPAAIWVASGSILSSLTGRNWCWGTTLRLSEGGKE